MPHQRRDALDARIVELWRSGVRSARDVGLQIGVTPTHVQSRIAGMIRTRTWPLDLPTKTPENDQAARRAPVGPAVHPRPSLPQEPALRAVPAPLTLRIQYDLHRRLRGYCRDTGATVSETVAEALEAFLRTKQDQRW